MNLLLAFSFCFLFIVGSGVPKDYKEPTPKGPNGPDENHCDYYG